MKTLIIIVLTALIGMSVVVSESVKFGSELKKINDVKAEQIDSLLAGLNK